MPGHKAATGPVILLLFLCALAPATTAVAAGAPAPGLPNLPAGWSLNISAGGLVLVHTPAEPLPLRDARPEFRDGGRLLGYPLERQGRLELPANARLLASLQSPSAWLSGRRLDGPTPAEPIARAAGTTPALATEVIDGTADPGTPGPYDTIALSYRLDDLAVEGLPAPVEVAAEVIAPVEASGRRPLVLFLHGRHSTCYGLEPEPYATSDWPCPEGTLPIPSYQGYRYAAELLASQGYLTVSISANGINGQDGYIPDSGAAARSALIRHHLDLWAEWSTIGLSPWGGRFVGAVDMDQVVLVGHSRGGEGVERAAVDSTAADPYTIVGLVPIAPTAFGRQVATGVTTAVILPYCDGDVLDLQGQLYVDESRDLTFSRALRSVVLVMGANHNYFNTEWTPGLAVAPAEDDWGWSAAVDDPACSAEGSSRLTPAQQQAVGATYIAALARVAVEGEASALPLLDGSRVRANSTGTARVLTHALGGRRELVYRPRMRDLLVTNGFSARVCRGYGRLPDPDQHSDCAPASLTRLPHWLPMMGAGTAPSPVALDLQWTRSGGTMRLTLSAAKDLTRATSLDLRLAVDPLSPPADLGLRLVDGRGRVATLPAAYRVAALPGVTSPLGKIWAQTLRFEITAIPAGFDLAAVTGIELVSRSSRGRAWLLDVSARRPGVAASAPVALPQVSLVATEIPEGGPGSRTANLPIEIRGDIVRSAALWVTVVTPDGDSDGYRLTLPPGTTTAAVPLSVEGNDTFNLYPREYMVTIKALSQVTTGNYTATLKVVEDDPSPTLTFTATRGRVSEGGTLSFTAALSAPINDDLWYTVTLGEVSGRPTLWTDDATPEFLLEWAGWIPDPPQPLWQALYPSLHIPAGSTTATFEIPTVADGITEGREVILVTLESWDDPLLPVPITVQGVVRAG